MTNMLSIGGSAAAAASKTRLFRILLALNLIVQSIAALVALVAPEFMARTLDFSFPAEALPLVRIWGAMVIFISLFQAPGVLAPIAARLPVMIGIAGRFLMAILYLSLGGAFHILAAIDGVFAVVLSLSFLSMVKAELMTRP